MESDELVECEICGQMYYSDELFYGICEKCESEWYEEVYEPEQGWDSVGASYPPFW